MKTLGDHIRKRRLEAGHSQAALAGMFGVNRNAVTNWEAGLQEPNLDKMPDVVAFVGRAALPTCQSLAKRIRLERRAAGLTQTELAGLLGVSRETVNLWESGKRAPKGRQLERVHGFLTAHRDNAHAIVKPMKTKSFGPSASNLPRPRP